MDPVQLLRLWSTASPWFCIKPLLTAALFLVLSSHAKQEEAVIYFSLLMSLGQLLARHTCLCNPGTQRWGLETTTAILGIRGAILGVWVGLSSLELCRRWVEGTLKSSPNPPRSPSLALMFSSGLCVSHIPSGYILLRMRVIWWISQHSHMNVDNPRQSVWMSENSVSHKWNVNSLLLAAKTTIATRWKDHNPPSITQWQYKLWNHFTMETIRTY